MRINKFIAENTGFSRRKADELLQNNQVTVNGKAPNGFGMDIDPSRDMVKVQGKLIQVKNNKVYLALNKPAGYVSTRKDDQDRPTVMKLVPKIANLKPVGRLDQPSEGLLLFSNDGEFINRFTHPRFECEKEYYVIIQGELTPSLKKELEDGVKIEGKITAKAKIKILKYEKDTFLRITIHEGRKRQIRKMFAYISCPVKYLQRIRIGKITLGRLPKGKFRKLTTAEINDY